jgi:DHA1 family inner membrane transport protein
LVSARREQADVLPTTGWRMTSTSNWRLVLILVFAGVIAAFQIGKAAIAVPLIRQDLELSLAMASWVIGAYGALGAVAGISAGVAVSFIGARNAAVTGLLAIGLASTLGAAANNGGILIAARVVEGCGFLAVVIAIPTLLRNVTAGRDRELAMVFWASYLPAGSAIMMLAGPLLASFGWRGLWLANGALAACYALVLWRLAPADARAAQAANWIPLAHMKGVLGARGPLLLSCAFFLYTFQYFALTGLMPTLLVERMGLSIAAAGSISALTVAANAFGNLSAGLFLRRGIPLWTILAAAFGFLGIAGFGIFASLPVVIVALLAAASLAVTGLIPASIFAASPRIAPASHLLAVILGLLIQASNIGQLLGPAAFGAWVEHYGWAQASVFFLAVALAGVAIAVWLRRLLPPAS